MSSPGTAFTLPTVLHEGIACSVLWESDTNKVVNQLAAFIKVVQRARISDARLSFRLTFARHDSPEKKRELYESRSALFESLLMAIEEALPYLVSLRLVVPEYVRKYVDSVLCRPAPHLRDFAMQDFGMQSPVREEPLIQLPGNLFAGHAPELRSVSLSSVSLPPEPISAFKCATYVRLDFDEKFPEVDLRRHFPALNSLHFAYNRLVSAAPPGCILGGLQLTTLTIDTDIVMLRLISKTLDMTSIPVVRIYEDADDIHDWQSTVRAQDRTELHATISEPGLSSDEAEEYVTAVVSLSRAGLRREFRIREWSLEEPHALLGQGSGIVSLRMENTFIAGFLSSSVSLPSLRDIRIDMRTSGFYATMIWPPAWGVCFDLEYGGDVYDVSCPYLETLSIVAPETPMQIEGSEVLNLGTALELSDRPECERPRLVLRGVTFRNPADLTDVFSSVLS